MTKPELNKSAPRAPLSIGFRLARALEELWIFLFAWIPTPLGVLLRLWAWRFFFAKCGGSRFGVNLAISGMKNISFGRGNRIGRSCFLSAASGKLVLGDYVSVSPCSHLGADNGEIIIGDYVAIGPGCVLRAANHNFKRVDIPIMAQGHNFGQIIIEKDVWIGANCVITPNSHIGEGAVVGAGAVVTKNVEAWSIVGGVPARIIGWRKKPEKGERNGDKVSGV